MKFILSRKGFDSTYGGTPSPAFPDGSMLSLPIPEPDDTGRTFANLDLRGFAVKPGFCHLDPDIRPGLYQELPPGWQPLFGQCGGAQTHLANNGVGSGDIFLFFGTFRRVVEKRGTWRFEGAPFHAIWGYLQVDRIITGGEIKDYTWHPHSRKYYDKYPNNALYLGREKLSLNDREPGYGVFTLNQPDWASPLILTLPNGTNRLSCWDYHKLFWLDENQQKARTKAGITHHNPNSFKDEYFQSAPIGQEFIIAESQTETVLPWFRKILAFR